ncbi:MAG: helix-turn-helix domain-containing protein, partial [Bacteroidales bacterium]|nr:helix-turn-helix domain-containing protein [Bacteroidales bacterium]
RVPATHNDLSMYLSVSDGSLTPVYDYMFGINTRKGQLRESVNNAAIDLYGLSGGRNVIQFKIRRTDYPAESPLYTVILNVLRPWYFWAALALVLAGTALMFFLFNNLRRRRKEAEKERQERELQEQVNIHNLDFFANISHEFRAPLTLINAAVASLGEEGESKEDSQHTLGIVRRNVGRMLKLVTQMLDFNKLDHDMLKLNVSLTNVPDIIRRSWEIFEIGAGQKNIDFSLTGCDSDRLGFIDADKLEKIIYNLCSNALKFTPPGGRIDVDCKWDNDTLDVSVADTGIGLEEDRIESIFERFSQTEPARKAGGTGIGLYFTKSLVEMHHGHITAENRYAGDDREHSLGSVFRFSIPLSESEYSDEEKAAPDDLVMPAENVSENAGAIIEHESEELRQDLPTLLLIDDDYELVYYMKSLFAPKYNVFFRFDAMSGYNQVKEVNPDVIICDMMMMDVDGLEFCRMIKENIEMCHIPVIMLTARSSVEDQINSLNVGADAYVIKPFNPEYLQALVKSMVDNRNRMRQILTTSITTPSEGAEKLNAKDKLFMDKFYANLESSLAEGEIDIDSLASKLGVSRSKFFYKIKALTGQTPGEFFTTYKLNRAAQLILEGKHKISTVAAMVGFSSPSHFSAVFKKRFGVLPSQYEGPQ